MQQHIHVFLHKNSQWSKPYIKQVGSNPLEVKNLRRLFQKFNALRQLKGDTKDNWRAHLPQFKQPIKAIITSDMQCPHFRTLCRSNIFLVIIQKEDFTAFDLDFLFFFYLTEHRFNVLLLPFRKTDQTIIKTQPAKSSNISRAYVIRVFYNLTDPRCSHNEAIMHVCKLSMGMDKLKFDKISSIL